MADDELTRVLALLLDSNPGMAEKLMRTHVDDGRGRCAGCVSVAHQPPWPCSISWHVTRANELPPVPPVRAVPGFTEFTSGPGRTEKIPTPGPGPRRAAPRRGTR